jgi:hypothetical protein
MKASKESELIAEFYTSKHVEESGVQIAYGDTWNILVRRNQTPRAFWAKYVGRQFDIVEYFLLGITPASIL